MIVRPIAAGIAVAVLLAASPASAALITDVDPSPDLVLNTDPTEFFQQTTSSPCVIGGDNCQNPGTFDYTDAPSGGSGVLQDLLSPLYTTAQIEGVTGGSSAFVMGLDYNQTKIAQTLYLFEAQYYVGAVLQSTQLFDITTLLPTNNNGAGYSDFLLSGFLIPDGTTNVQFRARWFNNDGPDRYFIVGADEPACTENCTTTAPEPASLSLFGIAAAAAGFVRRRRNS